VELLPHLRRDRVDRVGEDGRGRHDRDHLIEEVRAVIAEGLAVRPGFAFEQNDLVAPFAEAEEEGEEKRADHEPR